MTESLLATLQQWLLFSGAVVAVGTVAWRLVVVPRAYRMIADSDAPRLGRIERRVATVGIVAGLVLVVAWALRMVVQVRGFRDPFVPLWEDVSFLLFETFWGTVWMAQGAALPLLIGAFSWARGLAPEGVEAGSRGSARVPVAWWAVAALVFVVVATLALSSHAMGVDSGRALIVTADGLHALMAGTWIGSLGIILTVGRGWGESGEGPGVFAAQLRGFSPMAIVSVFSLIVMGVVLAWTHLPTLASLWTTRYGRVLSAKIGVAGSVFLAGFVNWRHGLPACDTLDGAKAVHRRAALEVALAAGVLLLTAVLVHTPQP